MIRKVVYIASPYTNGDKLANVQRQIEVAHSLMDMGHAPIAPLLSHYLEEWRARPWQEWMDIDLVILARCDVLLRLSGESKGADLEVAEARRLGIPVVFDLKDIAE